MLLQKQTVMDQHSSRKLLKGAALHEHALYLINLSSSTANGEMKQIICEGRNIAGRAVELAVLNERTYIDQNLTLHSNDDACTI